MVSSKQALDIILERAVPFFVEEQDFDKSTGHVVQQRVLADRPFPPFDRVMMDGIAIAHKSFLEGLRIFKIEGMQPAGAKATELDDPVNCIEVMTGAVLPGGCDTVIRYEDLKIKGGQAEIIIDEIDCGQNVHKKASDAAAGLELFGAGIPIGPPEVGVLASVGLSRVLTCLIPNIAVISTGDELVEVAEEPLPHQIRKSNVYCIKSLLDEFGCENQLYHLKDDEKEIRDGLEMVFEKHKIVLLSGGVSKGKFDFIPKILDDLGVVQCFHGVKQRPGKPFWFGQKDDQTTFAFPGNPVSTFLCLQKYFLPWLYKSAGLSPTQRIYAQLDGDFEFKPELTYFLQTKIKISKEGRIVAVPVPGRGSGDFGNLVFADAFMELPADKVNFRKGEAYPILSFRDWRKLII